MRKLLFLLLIILVGLTAYFASDSLATYFKGTPIPTTEVANMLQPAKSIDPFELTDTQGHRFTEKNLKGYWSLLFFGYTTCPKVCPETLSKMRHVFSLFPDNQPTPIRFFFVSLTPEHESSTQVETYLSQFHPAFIGLVGPQSEIIKLKAPLGIHTWTEKNNNKPILGHTATLMLFNPQGRLAAVFSPPHIPEKIASDLMLLTKARRPAA